MSDVILTGDQFRAMNAEIERLRKLAIECGAMDVSPCDVCGYNGPGFFQPDQHPCAAIFHSSVSKSGGETDE